MSHEAPYERLVTFAQWVAWSFVLDDQHDHLIRTGRFEAWHPFAQAATGHLAGERAPQLPRNPLASAFVELCDRILADMPTGPRERYRSHVPEMLSALDQEAANRTASGLPRLIDYILTRRHSSQLPAMMDMSEAGLGIEVPTEVYTSSVFQELIWSAWMSFPGAMTCSPCARSRPAGTTTTSPSCWSSGTVSRCHRS